MVDLELTRTPQDRRLYALEGVGTLRLQGFASRGATAQADAQRWTIRRRGFWQRRIDANDEVGTTVGTFEPHSLRRGGTVRWDGSTFTLRAASSWRERYALADGAREVALLDGRRRPVRITVDDPAAINAGLLLFTAFIVRGLAGDASDAAGATVVVSSGG